MDSHSPRRGFTLIELLVVIAIIAVLAVVVVITLNPAELLKQSRDANRVSDMATLTSALNLYVTNQTGATTFSLGVASNTSLSLFDLQATSTAGDQCQGLGLPSFNTSTTGQAWQCAPSSTYRAVNGTGWLPVNLNQLSSGSPIGSLPVDPINQTSTGFFYSYNTNGSQFEVTANLESSKYKTQYGNNPNTSLFPEVISGGTPTVSALYSPTGLIGYWSMNEGSGSSTIDQSGNKNNGTWSGTPTGNNGTYYTGGKVGNYAGVFDGTSNEVLVPTSPSINTAITNFTVSFWVQPKSCTGGNAYGRYFTQGVYPNEPIHIGCAGDATSMSYGNNGTFVAMSTVFSPGTWYFIAYVGNAGNMYVYVNGVKDASSATYTPPLPTGSATNIGGGNGFSGSLMDDVRFYNRALSPAEIQAMYIAEH